jgi:hypothetical protein
MSNYTTDHASMKRTKLLETTLDKLAERGVAVFVSDDGKIALRKIGDTKLKIDGPNAPDPALAFENCHENSESFNKGKSKKPEHATADAARLSKISAELKRATMDQAIRSRSFAELTKAKSAAMWQGRTPKPLAVRHG